MTERHLSLNQQIALLAAAIPDPVLDFLEDFNYGSALQGEGARGAFDPDYLNAHSSELQTSLNQLRQEMGKLVALQVDQGGREIPGAYLLKLTFENGLRGLGLLTKLKERTILRVVFQSGEYNEAALRELVKNPPSQG